MFPRHLVGRDVSPGGVGNAGRVRGEHTAAATEAVLHRFAAINALRAAAIVATLADTTRVLAAAR
jgi:hypothetical protein